MSKIVIVTDSTCDLAQETIKERNIVVLPLKVTFGGKTYLDTVDIHSDKMYEIVEETGELPKTSGASSEDFYNKFKEIYDENNGCEIIFCGIGARLSTTLQSATIAKNDLGEIQDHIHLVDSASLSTGIGLLILKMCDMRDEGLEVDKIIENIEKIVPCVRTQFSVKKLDYLHKGGRCSGTKRFFGTMLRIRPILRVFKGELILADKAYGKYEKALDIQLEDIKNNLNDVDTDYLFVTDSGTDEVTKEATQYVLDNLGDDVRSKFKHIYNTHAGCVISSHCGPGTVGILYIKKTPLKDTK